MDMTPGAQKKFNIICLVLIGFFLLWFTWDYNPINLHWRLKKIEEHVVIK